MKWFPKVLLKWREPKSFMRLADQLARAQSRWWHQPFAVLVMTLMFLVPWYLARFVPSRHPPPFEMVIWSLPLGSAVLVYGIPWLVRLFPSEVRWFEQQVVRSRGNQNLILEYSKIRDFTWINGPEFNTLMLKYGSKERVVCLGVPLEIDTDYLTRLMEERGIHHELPEVADSGPVD